MKGTITYAVMVIVLVTMILSSCQQPGGNSPGSEYMPDMGHSVAYESNHYNYYYNNTWGSEKEYYEMAKPRYPVNGTVPRTRTAGAVKGISVPVQGSQPYYYADTEEERTRAIAEIIDNPYPITDAGLAHGKELYNVFCATCHGEKGDGAGWLYDTDQNPNAKYPVQPANFLSDEHVTASNGRYYHAIMHGKNLMGAYKDKMSAKERWEVIHYIRALQAKDKKLAYNQLENTLNSVDRPAGPEEVLAEVLSTDADHGHGHGHDHEEGFSHDHDHEHDGEHDGDHHQGEGH